MRRAPFGDGIRGEEWTNYDFNAFPAIAYSADSLCLRYPFLLRVPFTYFYNFLLFLLPFLFLLIGKVAHSTLAASLFSLFLGMGGGGTCAYWDEWERRHGSGGKGILSL